MASAAVNILVNVVAPTVGVLIGNVMWASPYPDLRAALKEGDLGALNPLPWSVTFGNCLAWTYYAKVVGFDYYIFFGNVFGVGWGVYYILSASRLLGMRTMKKAMESGAIPGTLAWEQAKINADPYNYRAITESFIVGSAVAMTAVVFFFDQYLSSDNLNPTRQLIVGILSTSIAMMYFLLPLYTLFEVCDTRDASSIQYLMIAANAVNCLSWTVYGLAAIDDPWVYGPNSAGLLLSIVQLAVKFYYSAHAKEAAFATDGSLDAKLAVPFSSEKTCKMGLC
jgi:solute carrier family 50 protein (sugar transporter)